MLLKWGSEGHNSLIHGVEIIFIDKTDLSDLTGREEFWTTMPKILAPSDLNAKDWLLLSSFW